MFGKCLSHSTDLLSTSLAPLKGIKSTKARNSWASQQDTALRDSERPCRSVFLRCKDLSFLKTDDRLRSPHVPLATTSDVDCRERLFKAVKMVCFLGGWRERLAKGRQDTCCLHVFVSPDISHGSHVALVILLLHVVISGFPVVL